MFFRCDSFWSYFKNLSDMPVGENHVEEEVKANWPKKEKCCYQPPELEFSYDLSRVEVKLKSRDHIQLNG